MSSSSKGYALIPLKDGVLSSPEATLAPCSQLPTNLGNLTVLPSPCCLHSQLSSVQVIDSHCRRSVEQFPTGDLRWQKVSSPRGDSHVADGTTDGKSVPEHTQRIQKKLHVKLRVPLDERQIVQITFWRLKDCTLIFYVFILSIKTLTN